MIKLKDKLLYSTLGFVLCFAIGIGTNYASAHIKRVKSLSERNKIIRKHELRQEYRLTRKSKLTFTSGVENPSRDNKKKSPE